jgi:diguanylate cyclase (GGDEF)-like protein
VTRDPDPETRGAEVLRLILVEDSPGDVRLVKEVLAPSRKPSFRVTTFTRVGDLEKVREDGDFDIMLLDLSLPDARGLDTVKKARALFPALPIIVMTGLDDEDVAVQAVKLGAQDYLVKGEYDLRGLVRTIRHAIERHRMVRELEKSRQRERYLATHDALTRLPNRQLFYEVMSQQLDLAARYRQPLVVMFLDLDGFKEINDSLGHEAGDRVLQEAAGRLKHCVRKSDTVARFGGDEFSVLLPRVKREGDEAVVARKILEVVRRPVVFRGRAVTVTASVGIALYPRDGSDPDTLLNTADASMYAAKQAGGDSFRGETLGTRKAVVQGGRKCGAGTR